MEMYNKCKKIALQLINDELSQQEIINKINMAAEVLKSSYPNNEIEIDKEKLLRELLSMNNTWIGKESELVDNTDHEPWLLDKKSTVEWKFWNRYKEYLEEEKSFASKVVLSVDSLTDKILGLIEDPKRSGRWDRRGMVVGQVQSGKTSNYTGLMCKAVDAGYKFIVVLAGMHNSLRSQTQSRLDEGFLGFDTQKNCSADHKDASLGVGRLQGHEELSVLSLTSSLENGDFKITTAKNVNYTLGGTAPVLLVVKKNASVLKHLNNWIKNRGKEDTVTGEIKVKGVPLLLIDDEADNASINGKQIGRDEKGKLLEEEDPTTINKRIRQLLNYFEQSAYIGYTATPFANIFIYPNEKEEENNKNGLDLFPRSFIINLPAPSNYVGATKLFGIKEDIDSDIEEQVGLPLVESINDYGDFIPNKHKKDWIPGELPESLKEAIRVFILSCTARMCRGQVKDHNSMLIHVTRYTDVQEIVSERIETELKNIQLQLEFESSSNSEIIREFKDLWQENFIPVTNEIIEKNQDPMTQQIEWKQIKEKLYKAASKIVVKKINGTAGDVLDYKNHANGLSVIAVGGDKLSRGLTLEGLTVSYYLRASKMYDTLMQMGRWFGYRPGYLDLCRLYTTGELITWYQHIARADEELRREFDFMAASGSTPEDYGLRVRTHPEGLKITAANKIRHGTRMSVSFSGSLVQTTAFSKKKTDLEWNFSVLKDWISTLEEVNCISKSYYAWGSRIEGKDYNNTITSKKIIDFLEKIKVHPLAKSAEPINLINYIQKLNRKEELIDWTVALINKSAGNTKEITEKYNVGCVKRSEKDNSTDEVFMIRNGQLITQKHEHIDMNKEEVNTAENETLKHWEKRSGKGNPPKTANGLYIRRQRSVKRGLLMLYLIDSGDEYKTPMVGFAISFPSSENAEPVEYMVNNRYWTEMYGDE